jgi:hypothetical protein
VRVRIRQRHGRLSPAQEVDLDQVRRRSQGIGLLPQVEIASGPRALVPRRQALDPVTTLALVAASTISTKTSRCSTSDSRTITGWSASVSLPGEYGCLRSDTNTSG